MLDAATVHPMLRTRRRRRLRRGLITATRLRLLAVLVLAGALLVGGGLWLTRADKPDPRRLLTDSLITLEAGNYSAARSNALAAVAAAPRFGIAQAVLARAYLELEDGLAAEAALGRAEQAGLPTDRLHQLRAHARLLQGDLAGAIAEADQAAPRYAAYAARMRARALAAQGAARAAKVALEGRVATAPRDGQAWTDLARLRLTGGDLGGASAAASEAARLRPRDPRALTLAGEVVRARYGLVAALPWFKAALKRDAFYHAALIEYAATLGEAGRHADMLAALRRAMAAQPSSPQAFYLRAVLAARAGRMELAVKLLDRSDRLPGATLLDGGLDYAAGRYEQAAAKWRALSDAQPMNIAVRRLLAAALLRSGEAQGALAVLRPLAVRADADSYALALTARAFEAVGDRVRAAAYLDRAAAGVPGPAAVFASNDTLATLTAAAAVAPTDSTYALGVIRGLVGAGDAAGAVAKAGALAAAGAGAPAAQLALGDALALAGRNPLPAYARAANLQFDEPTMLRLLDAQGRAGRPREAAATLALYLAQNPQSLVGQRLLGHLQLGAGEPGAAIETLEGVRRRIGNADVALLVDLALAYAAVENGELAQRYAAHAYAMQPMNAAAADAYGVALAAAGETEGARQLLDKAVALAPGNRAIAAHRLELG